MYDLTFREFSHKLEGYQQAREHEYRQRLDASRFTASLVISALSGKPISPAELVRFPWESAPKPKIMTLERFQKFEKVVKKIEHGKK